MFNFGINNQKFREEIFEKNIYFKQGALLELPIHWANISEILNTWDPEDKKLIVHRNGVLPLLAYTERYQDLDDVCHRLNPMKFLPLLKEGATVLFNRIDKKSTKLAKLCSHLANFSGQKTVANGYAAFGGNGTFGKHWDTHDVFAVQLLGRKRWQVFTPTFDLPLDHQRSRYVKHECPAKPIFDEILEAGDILYIPRGWWHEALPIAGNDTFHIAAGVHTAKLADYISWVCEDKLAADLRFRKTINSRAECTEQLSHSGFSKILNSPDQMDMFIRQMQAMLNMFEPIQLETLVRSSGLSTSTCTVVNSKELSVTSNNC